MSNYENKIWYRLVKSIYVFFYFLAVVGAPFVIWDGYDSVSNYDLADKIMKEDRNLYLAIREISGTSYNGKSLYSEYSVTNYLDNNREMPAIKEYLDSMITTQIWHRILWTPVVLFLIWLTFIFIQRVFFYIIAGEKFLRMPKKLFD